MAIKVNRVTNANVYINGNSFLGKAEEVQAPVIKHKLAEHKALGMVGSVEFFSGIEKMEAKIKWNSFYSDVMSLISNPVAAVQLQVRSSIEEYTSSGRTSEVPYVCYMTGSFKDIPAGNFKQHENVEVESNLSITYCRIEIGGIAKLEIDVLANIYKVDGVDILSQYRSNIGA